jgi:Family of unknown function (DUF6788)
VRVSASSTSGWRARSREPTPQPLTIRSAKHPRRHGPYYQLNHVYRGKKTSQFIRRNILGQVRTELVNYKQFRRLTERWIGLALQVAQVKDKLAS